METAWLVTNAYLTGDRFDALYRRLAEAARGRGVELLRCTNEDVHLGRAAGQPRFVLFWDKDVRAAELLENAGHTVINSARAIELCDDKAKTYTALLAAGIPMPETLLCPLSFHGIAEARAIACEVGHKLSYPLVVKECCGSFGNEVYLAQDEQELSAMIEKLSPTPLLFSRFVEESRGRDLRVYVVGGRAIACMLRENPCDFRSNLAGGSVSAVTPPPEYLKLAVDACAALHLDFGGVDILLGERPLLCEVNSNAHFLKIEKCTGIDVADALIAYALSRAAAQ